MPVAGLLIGRQASLFLGTAAGYGAGALLILVGAWEMREALSDDEHSKPAVVGSPARIAPPHRIIG